MKYLNDGYVKIYTHKGYDICTLKMATKDELGYVINDSKFYGKSFKLIDDAIKEINKRSNVNCDAITLQECIAMKEILKMATVIENGHVTGFMKEDGKSERIGIRED